MSVAALTWAFAQKIESSAKFVLVALADYANEECEAYPSVRALREKTCLNAKTILLALKHLRNLDLIEDTGNRVGKTKSVPVYQLKHTQKRSSSKIGAHPDLPASTPKNGLGKHTLKRVTEPSVLEPSVEPSDIPAKSKASSEQEVVDYVRSLGLPKSDGQFLWLNWEENGWRKGNGKPLKDWKLAVQKWQSAKWFPSQKIKGFQSNGSDSHAGEWIDSNKDDGPPREFDPDYYGTQERYEETCKLCGWNPIL